MSCKAQALCQTDMNASSSEDKTHVTATNPHQHNKAAGKPTVSSAQLRHQYVQALSTEKFDHLVHHVETAQAKVMAVTISTFWKSDELAICYYSSQRCVYKPD